MFKRNTRNIIEGFGEGARAQISSNQDDNTLYGGGEVMAANSFATSGYQSQFNNVLSQTTPQQYQQMATHQGGGNGWGSTGSPNHAGHNPTRPTHQTDFSPHIQQQFLKYENQLRAERQRNKQLQNRIGGGFSFGNGGNGGNGGSGLLGQINNLIEQIFRFILGILNILIGWLF